MIVRPLGEPILGEYSGFTLRPSSWRERLALVIIGWCCRGPQRRAWLWPYAVGMTIKNDDTRKVCNFRVPVSGQALSERATNMAFDVLFNAVEKAREDAADEQEGQEDE